MPSTFSRTIRSLEGDSPRRGAVMLFFAGALVFAWGAWFFLGRVAVYEVTDTARLEVESSVHPVSARVDGQVVETSLTIGREVEVGNVLMKLDSESERLALEESRKRRVDVLSQLKALQVQIQSEKDAAGASREANTVAVNEANARFQAARSRAEFARLQAEKIDTLHAKGVASEEALREARANADSSQAELEALRLAANRLEQGRNVDALDRKTRIASLEREAVKLEGQAATEEATIRKLEREIELRTIRAPVSGHVGEAQEIRVGSVVRAGQKLGSVVPPGTIRAVAFFPVSSVGRVRAGQPSRLRLEGFPWTRYGTLKATVSEVGSEPADGLIRVELAVNAESASLIPREHGLPGSAEVEVERLSPAELALRVAGKVLSPHVPWRPPTETETESGPR